MIKYFSNCYIHKKEARSRLFKMQDLPSTYVSIPKVWIPAQLVLSIDTNLSWILSLFQDQKYLEEQSMFLYTLKHMPYSGSNSKSWPLTFHLIDQSAVARMCCFTMVVQWPLFELIRFLFSMLVKGPFLRSTGQTAVFSNQDMFHNS